MSILSKIRPCVGAWANTALKKVTSSPSLSEKAASQALQNLNQYTLELYARQKAIVRAQLGQKTPVILANQNLLSLRYNNIRRDVEYIPKQYHDLKALAHSPIAVYMACLRGDAQESERLLMKLEGLFRPY
jgi:hypothetical protein